MIEHKLLYHIKVLVGFSFISYQQLIHFFWISKLFTIFLKNTLPGMTKMTESIVFKKQNNVCSPTFSNFFQTFCLHFTRLLTTSISSLLRN